MRAHTQKGKCLKGGPVKIRRARKKREPTIPVQIRVPMTLHEAIARRAPKDWTKQQLILRILTQVMDDPTFVLEIPA